MRYLAPLILLMVSGCMSQAERDQGRSEYLDTAERHWRCVREYCYDKGRAGNARIADALSC